MSEQSLDDLLNDVPEPEAQAPETPEPQETGEATPEAETKTDESADETPQEAETPEAKQEEGESWTKAAVIDERRKRQELERKLAELEASKAENKPERPDVFADPDGAFSHVEQSLKNEMAMAIHSTRLELSQEMMRTVFPDYDELESEFVDMAKDNPVLLQELQNSTMPARFAYDTAKKAREAAELKNVDKMRAKMEAEIRAEIEAQIKQEAEQTQAKSAEKQKALTPSLAATQSKGSIDDSVDESLESILSGT